MRGKYTAFGLVIDSSIPLPEAYPAESEATVDVTVTSGTAGEDFPVDSGLVKARENKLWWHGIRDESRMLFNCKSGLFEIRDGSEIIMQLYPDADAEHVKVFLLGSAMGAVQVQRGRIPVHGGAVVTTKGAMIIAGGQGVGKSTMTSAFVHNGFKFLTDDVSSIVIENGRADIIPAYPQRKLLRDACAPLGYNPEDLVQLNDERDKLAVRDRENWQSQPVVLSAIIELYHASGDDRVSVSPVAGRDKLACVMRNLYRRWMHVPGGDIAPVTLKKILTIAAQANIYRVGVPRDIKAITSVVRDIAAALGVYRSGILSQADWLASGKVI